MPIVDKTIISDPAGDILNVTTGGAITVDGSATTQPVSDGGGSLTVDGAVTVSSTDLDIRNLAFATDKVDASGSSVSISGSVAVTGPLTDVQLRAIPVPVSVTSTTITGSIDTELPTPIVLAENMVNPTVPGVAAFGMVHDGGNVWDRMRGNSTDGLLVDLGPNNDVSIINDIRIWDSSTILQISSSSSNSSSGILIYGKDTSGNADYPLQILSLPNAKPLTVALVNTDGNQILGGGTQYNEGVVGGDKTGNLILWFDNNSSAYKGTSDTQPLPVEIKLPTVLPVSTGLTEALKVLGTDTYLEGNTQSLLISAIRRDADTTLVNLTNEVAPLQVDANGRLKVEVFSGETLPVSLTSTTITGSVAVTGPLTDTQLRATPVPISGTITATPTGTQNVDVTANTIGLATGVKQDTGNNSLSSIDTKTPVLGQALAAASTPVVLTAAQVTTLTPQINALTDTQLRATAVPISGTITATATNLDIRDLTFAADKVDASGSSVSITGSVAVTGPLTDTQLRATAVPVSLTSTTITGTVAVSATNLDIRDLTFAADKVDASGTVLGASTNNIGDVDVLTLPALSTGNNVIGQVKLTDGTDVADVLDLVNSNPLTVAIVDGAGTQITSFGGGTQYTEGDTDASITGTAMLWEDTTDTLRAVSAAKPLPVNIIGGSSSGTEYTEGAIDATITGTAILMEVAADTLQPVQGTVADGLLVNLGANNDVTVTGSVAVTGPLTDAQLRASVVPVSLTSTTVTGTVAVTGPLTDTQLRATPVPVSGTIASTQSGTWNIATVTAVTAITNALPAGTNAIGKLSVNDGIDIGDVTINNASGVSSVNIQDGGNSLTVDAPVGTPVFVRLSDGVAAITALPITDNAGSLTVDNAGTFVIQENGAALTALQLIDDTVATTGSGIVTKGIAAVGTDGLNARILKTDAAGELQIDVVSITPPTLTKATQGATGFSTQDLKDAGRSFITFNADAVAGATTNTILTFSKNTNNTVAATQTSHTITNGKTFKIQSITFALKSAAAAIAFSKIYLRSNSAGATVAGSNILWSTEISTNSTTSGTSDFINIPFPDGIDIVGDGTRSIGISQISQATTNLISVTLVGYEY